MSKINESEVNPADVKAVFKAAAGSRENQGILANVSKRFRKDSVDVKDLQQAWKEEGFPDDLRDIERILKDHGFDKKEINKVFSQVFGQEGKGYETPVASPTIQKIADFAKENGIEQALISFLEQEYGIAESHAFDGKALVENIRDIFTAIVSEERTARPKLIKTQDKTQLGRNRK
jgi:hypothetical protein